ncbi:NAD(P)-binding domain-containing protein, partial [Treponema sp. R6D11]
MIIYGGNLNYQDTKRRTSFVESKGFLYIRTGVSGGEESALKGPSVMARGPPGGGGFLGVFLPVLTAGFFFFAVGFAFTG